MTRSGSPSGKDAHADEQHVVSSGRSHIEPPSQDLGLHLEPLPGAASQAAAAEELHGGGAARPAHTRSLLGASQETLACESEGVAPQAPAINPAAALRTSSRKRAAAVAAAATSQADSWAAETLTALGGSQGRCPPPHLPLPQPLMHMEAPEDMDPMAGMAEYDEEPDMGMAHMGQPMDAATQAVVAQQLGHLGLLPWSNIDLQSLVLQAASTGLQVARAGRAARYNRYNMGDSSDPEAMDLLPVRAPPRRGQHSSGLTKPEHANSVAKRRGPMDEMRQLMRILVQVIPAAADCVSTGEEGTSNNKVKERDIHLFLRKVLGNNMPGSAPYPEWGLPEGSIHVGWGGYLAALFSWAVNRPISKEEAMQCARRQQGRRWEAVYETLQELGVYSYNWTVPLNQMQTRTAPPEIPLRLLREEQREPLLVEAPMAEAVVAAAQAVGGPGVAAQSIGLGVAGRKQQALGPKAKRQRSGPLLTQAEPMSPPLMAPPAAPLLPFLSPQEVEEGMGRLPLMEQWKVLTNIIHNMENLVHETYSNRPAHEEELKVRGLAWRAMTHLQDLCKQQEANAAYEASAAAAAAAAGGGAAAAGDEPPGSPAGAGGAAGPGTGGGAGGAASQGGRDMSQVQVPVLTMADLGSEQVVPLPYLSQNMAMLQGGAGMAALQHANIQHLINAQLQPGTQAALAAAAAAGARVAVQMEQVPLAMRLGGLVGSTKPAAAAPASPPGATGAAGAGAGAGAASGAADAAGSPGQQQQPQLSPSKHADQLRSMVHSMIEAGQRVKPVA